MSGTLMYIQVDAISSFLWLLFTSVLYLPEISSATEGGKEKPEKSPLRILQFKKYDFPHYFLCAILNGSIKMYK